MCFLIMMVTIIAKTPIALAVWCIVHVPYACIDLNKPYNNPIQWYYDHLNFIVEKLREKEVTHLESDIAWI